MELIINGCGASIKRPQLFYIHTILLPEQNQIIRIADQHHFMKLTGFTIPHTGSLFSGADTAAENRFVALGRKK